MAGGMEEGARNPGAIAGSAPVSRIAALLRAQRVDFLICAGLFALTVLHVLYLQHLLAFTNTYIDIWFDSDSIFIVDQNTNRMSPVNGTNSRHPIYVLLTFPLGYILGKLGLEPALATLPATALYSALFIVAMYCALRLSKKSVAVSLVFTSVLAASAPCVLFLGIHERLILGGLTILVFINALLLHQRRLVGEATLIAAAVLTLGVTITNFLIAVVALPLALGLRRGLQAIASAIAIVAMLGVIVQVVFPSSSVFLDVRSYPYQTTTLSGQADRISKGGTLADRATVYFLSAIALPEPQVQQKPEGSPVRYLSIQKAGVWGHAVTWYLAGALWLTLLALGARALFRDLNLRQVLTREGMARALRSGVPDPLPWALVATALGQCCLFMVFGAEIVLFSPYYVPILVLIAATAWRDAASDKVILRLSLLFLLFLIWNNAQTFAQALSMAYTLLPSGGT